MCLIVFAFNKHPKYKLILAANRDEYFNRPTLTADYWKENHEILGGRDIQSKGTWLGINKNGKFIAITNYRDPKIEKKRALSRGKLSKIFLSNNQNIRSFLADVSNNKENYNGFNLLLSDDGFNTLYHYSNISNTTAKISNGLHGLSNHLLDSSWPKVDTGKENLNIKIESASLNVNDLVEMLKNGNVAADELLPDTGISYDLEKKLSPVFISMKGYGTRCSTAILVDTENNVSFLEVSYNENKQVISKKKHQLILKP